MGHVHVPSMCQAIRGRVTRTRYLFKAEHLGSHRKNSPSQALRFTQVQSHQHEGYHQGVCAVRRPNLSPGDDVRCACVGRSTEPCSLYRTPHQFTTRIGMAKSESYLLFNLALSDHAESTTRNNRSRIRRLVCLLVDFPRYGNGTLES